MKTIIINKINLSITWLIQHLTFYNSLHNKYTKLVYFCSGKTFVQRTIFDTIYNQFINIHIYVHTQYYWPYLWSCQLKNYNCNLLQFHIITLNLSSISPSIIAFWNKYYIGGYINNDILQQHTVPRALHVDNVSNLLIHFIIFTTQQLSVTSQCHSCML